MISLQAFALMAALTGAGETVLLEFHADWCGPCRTMAPTLRRLSGEGYPVRKVDVDQQRDLVNRYQVQSVPTFILLKNGQEVERLTGATSHERLKRMFQEAGVRLTDNPAQVRGQAPESPPQAAPPQAAEPAASLSPQQRALQATVRLKVEDAQGHSYGTGTIIDTHGEEALVVTCGHIFRDSRGQGKIRVDLFLPGAPAPVAGQLIAYDADERDIGVISIRPGIEVTPVPVAPGSYRPRPEEKVFTVGCDRGADPTVQPSRITAVNKYLGAPNIEVAGQPVDGRSGGGLFSADGLLMGICNAADPADDEGVYAGLATVHWQLDQIGQQRIYERSEALLAQGSPARTQPAKHNLANFDPPGMPSRMPGQAASQTAGQTGSPGRAAEPLAATAPAAFSQDSRLPKPPEARLTALLDEAPEDAEIICIVRSRSDPQGKNRVIVLDQPSPELLDRLTRESRQPAPGQNRNHQQVVRGQSAD